MKPNFSLILSGEGMSLAHRTQSGWSRVGEVAFDDPDMPAAISALQDRAQRVPGDRSCKLIIPEDQIKYLMLEAEGDPDAAVQAALKGATPYAVDELEYDWTAEGGVIRVAAVALETLAEAESFAVEHGFEPVSFAAIPAQNDFIGEPFFGATRWAATALPKGTAIERDAAPVHVTSDANGIGDDASGDDVPGDDAPVAAAATRAVADAGPAPKPQKAQVDGAGPAANEPDARTPEKSADKTADKTMGKAASPGTVAPDAAQKEATARVPASGAPKSAGDAAPSRASSAAPAPTPEKDPSDRNGPASFSSIRASRAMDDAPRAPVAAGPPRLTRPGGADTAPAASAAPRLPSPADNSATDPVLMAELAASLLPDPDARLDRDAKPETQKTPADGSALPGLFGKRETRDTQTGARGKGAAPKRSDEERRRMTVFGARQSDVRGKPRFLGLILTAVLLLCLVGVAAWASVFLDDGLARLFRGADIKLANVPATNGSQTDPAADKGAEDAPAPIAPLPDGTAESRTASLPAESTPRPEVTSLPDRPLPLSPSEALARYAATGIWQMAPAPPETPGAGAPITDLYQVSLDPGIDLGLPDTLPRRVPNALDKAPEAPGIPPPAGTRFDFDARGLVRATPEGAVTPEGVRIVAGSPPLTPPADMAQTVTVTAQVPPAGAEEGPGTQTEIIDFTGDPALAGVRPRARPSGSLTDRDAAEDEESGAAQIPSPTETSIAGTGDDATGGASSLAVLRPQPRPEQMTAAAATLLTTEGTAAAPLVEGAALTRAIAAASAQPEVSVGQDLEELDDTAFDGATPQAVTASLTPLRRPGDFDTIVKQTRAQPQPQSVPTTQQRQPALPSSASVAKRATDTDVLNMRDVNLIGVYGSTASRRALVRLGNGRYRKVRVGDTLDGGQVAAIGEGELRYVKRGRNIVLRMPQG